MFDLCLFDLDNTLVATDDLDHIRLRGKGNNSGEYSAELLECFRSIDGPYIFSEVFLADVQKRFPQTKFGIFTRAPRSYACTILREAYPSITWDAIITYDDVEKTKPHGDGIHLAMDQLNLDTLSRVLLVGDGDVDIRAAYNAGVVVALSRIAWPDRLITDNWNSLGHIPDAVLEDPTDLISVLELIPKHLPDLEHRLSDFSDEESDFRFDRINKFIPRNVGGDNTAYHVHTCGRYFSKYPSVRERSKWHRLTESIQDNKNSIEFPNEWVQSVHKFLDLKVTTMPWGNPLVVTVIPHRPERLPRLENFLGQLETYVNRNPFFGSSNILFDPAILAYNEGVRSHSNDKLSGDDRFINVREHLRVAKPEIVAQGNNVVIIDDVCTTGSSLIYAGIRLSEAGAGSATRLAISMNISKVLDD